MSNILTLRVQSPYGTKRIDFTSTDSYNTIHEKVAKIFSLDSSDSFVLYRKQNKQLPIRRTSESVDFRHGDMIYLDVSLQEDNCPVIITSDSNNSSVHSAIDFFSNLTNNIDDDVDLKLDKMDGKMTREKNPQLCRHNNHGKCLHCMPVEPYDEEYLKQHDPPIKYLSFHAYIRKLQHLYPDRNKFAELKNINCSVKSECTSKHPAYPNGICSNCQPNPINLFRQPFRHVDNIMFENGNMVNRFLNYWRSMGHQRIGYLYGRYEPFTGIPLGIRAIVCAIYEPPQETTKESVQLKFPDPMEETVEKLADSLHIRRIGWIFTDLIPDDERLGDGPVLHHRGNSKTFFLTAQECIMAAWLQNKYRNKCKYSPDAYFGSKFVTVVVTGDPAGQIHFEGYQVSNQCMALGNAEIIFPTLDAPELGYIKETTSEQYVPDVFYKDKDANNIEIKKLARPLPLEYLIVDIPTGFPTVQSKMQCMFNDNCQLIEVPFCIENRDDHNEFQDMDTLALYLQQFVGNKSSPMHINFHQPKDVLGDFHLLIYLLTNDVIPFTLRQLQPLLKAIHADDSHEIEKWMNNEQWKTLLELLQIKLPNYSLKSNSSSSDTLEEQTNEWICSQCTLLNDDSKEKCDACSFERQTTFS